MPTPRIIPVLDVMGGQVVRAVGGRRSEYRPVVSQFGDATDVIGMAKRMLDATESEWLYVADLDALTGRPANNRLISQLGSEFPDTRVWVDAGLRSEADFGRVPAWVSANTTDVPNTAELSCYWRRTGRWPFRRWERWGNICPVVGSETIVGPAAARAAAREFPMFLVASVDLLGGRLLGEWTAWSVDGVRNPTDVLGMAHALLRATGAGNVILLDLAAVGTGNGPATAAWLPALRDAYPQTRLVTGGGIRSHNDIARLGDAGADAVLVASALHDGLLT